MLFVFSTCWDEKQLAACRSAWIGKYRIEFPPPSDAACRWDFDAAEFISRTVEAARGRIDGVASSSDYPGATVAAAIATELGLPGPTPETAIRCSHKYYSRLAQKAAVPEATPEFALVDPDAPAGGLPQDVFPVFVKPVKGAFSVMARRMDSADQLQAFLTSPAASEFRTSFMGIFNQLVGVYTDFQFDGRYFIAEQILRGRQATVEGFVFAGDVEILGIVDSVLDRDTGSFVRFDYPSSLPADVRERMSDVAARAIRGLGLENTMFNIEMAYDAAADKIMIVEINPRMCGQFGDLYQKVDGVNGYEVALDIAAGKRPLLRRGMGMCRAASSFPLRVFEPARVLRVPSSFDIAEAENLHPGTLIWNECKEGSDLVDFEILEDGRSSRYAVVNVGADSTDSMRSRLEKIRGRLDHRFQRI